MIKIPFTSEMTKITLKYLEGYERCFFAAFKIKKNFQIFKTKLRKIHHLRKIIIFYDHIYVGNHLYCHGFTLASLILSFLNKILTINDNQHVRRKLQMHYIVMEKNFKHMKNKGMNSLFEKITIVDGLGPLQILFIARDPSPSLIHSFF